MGELRIISVREETDWTERVIRYFQDKWASEDSMKVYEDCILSCIDSDSPLPQWYVLAEGEKIVGCAGLITNDFISRMDLMPWLCALYIEPEYRGSNLGGRLVRHLCAEAARIGFDRLYLCTDHIGYYEKFGFDYLAEGYHPWGESSRVYEARVRI